MKLQTFFTAAGKYSCLAQCYIVAVVDFIRKGNHLTNDDTSLNMLIFETLQEAYNKYIITDDFFVNDPISLMKIALSHLVSTEGYNINVTKSPIDTPYTAVRYDYNGHSHWILKYNNETIYDSLEDSICVAKGKPTTVRYISLSQKSY